MNKIYPCKQLRNLQTQLSQRGFSHKNKYHLIFMWNILKKNVNDTIHHERLKNHVTFHTSILKTGSQFEKKNRKFVDADSINTLRDCTSIYIQFRGSAQPKHPRKLV